MGLRQSLFAIRCKNNKGIEAGALGDRIGLMQQIGAIPAVSPKK
jgi:hypothetical protein